MWTGRSSYLYLVDLCLLIYFCHVIEKASGSARVKLGATDIIASVKVSTWASNFDFPF